MDNQSSSRKRKERVFSPSSQGRAGQFKRTVAKRQKKLEKLMACPTPERDVKSIAKLEVAIDESKNKLADAIEKQGPPNPTPEKAPTPRLTRSTRATILTCRHYGKQRYAIFGPSADFCEPCHQWDLLPPDKQKRWDANAKRNRCKSKHTHYIIPSKKLCSFQAPKHKRVRKPTAESSNSSDDESTPLEHESVQSDNKINEVVILDSSKEQIGHLLPSQETVSSDDYMLLKRKHEKVLRQIRETNKKMKPTNIMEDMLSSMSNLSLEQQGRAATKISKKLLDAGISPILSPELKRQVIEEHNKVQRTSLFPPHEILKRMDLEGGGLCLNGIEILRKVENKDQIPFYHGFLPSSSKIKYCQRIVEGFARHKAPFEKFNLPKEFGGGEAIKFKIPDVVSLSFRGFKLDECCKTRSCMIAQSIDGAQLTNKVGHLTWGFKVIDEGAVCPITKKNKINGNGDSSFRAQSQNNCFPIMSVLAKETAKSYGIFNEPFKLFLDELNNETEESLIVPGAKPLDVVLNADMSAAWKVLGKGSGRGKAFRPCHCCSTPGDNWDRPNATPCTKFCAQWSVEQGEDLPAGWKCYHHDFLTEGRVAELNKELASAEAAIENLTVSVDELREKSTITYDEDDPRNPTGNAKNDPTSIYYDYKSLLTSAETAQEKAHAKECIRSFAVGVHNDLSIRKMDLTGRLPERVSRLRTRLIQEYTVKKLQVDIEHGTIGVDTAFFVLLNTIPCILHMENRIGIKIFTVLLTVGLKRAVNDNTMYPGLKRDKEKIRKFLEDVNHICNTKILGNVSSPSQWECPYESDDEEIGIISMENKKIRVVIENFSRLIQLCVSPHSSDRQDWHVCIYHYKKAMSRVRQKADLTDEQIVEFQYSADRFFQIWVTLNNGISVSGVTNYIHLLGSGHIAQYLFHWRNLYRHSQQGWEALNSMIKVYFFRRTQRGGGKGERSKLKALGRWFARRAVWIAGYTYEEMAEYVRNNPDCLKEDVDTTDDAVDSENDEEEEEYLTDYEDEEDIWIAGLQND